MKTQDDAAASKKKEPSQKTTDQVTKPAKDQKKAEVETKKDQPKNGKLNSEAASSQKDARSNKSKACGEKKTQDSNKEKSETSEAGQKKDNSKSCNTGEHGKKKEKTAPIETLRRDPAKENKQKKAPTNQPTDVLPAQRKRDAEADSSLSSERPSKRHVPSQGENLDTPPPKRKAGQMDNVTAKRSKTQDISAKGGMNWVKFPTTTLKPFY